MNVLYREWVVSQKHFSLNLSLVSTWSLQLLKLCSLTSNMTYYHGTLMFRKGSVAYTITVKFHIIQQPRCESIVCRSTAYWDYHRNYSSYPTFYFRSLQIRSNVQWASNYQILWSELMTQVCFKCLYSLMKVCLLTGFYSIAPTRRCDFALLCNKYLYAQVAWQAGKTPYKWFCVCLPWSAWFLWTCLSLLPYNLVNLVATAVHSVLK